MRTTSLGACQGWPHLEALEPRILLDAAAEAQVLELLGAGPALLAENQGQWAGEFPGVGTGGAASEAGPQGPAADPGDGIPVELLGQWGGSIFDSAVVGDYAYVCQGISLDVLDVSDPARPVEVGSVLLSDMARSVAVSGNLACVADGSAGLQIIDVSNPSAPVRRGGYDTSGYALGVYVSGALAYVADTDSGLQIIDVSDPAAPVWLGGYDTSGDADRVFVSGNLAYVADCAGGLQIIDVSDPEAPVWGGECTVGYAYDVFVSGNVAYVADADAGLQIIDVSDPGAPAWLGGYNTGGYAYDVFVSGNLAYVADGLAGLQIIDVSDPAAPVWRGGYDTSGYTYDVFVSGNLAYVADFYTGLQIIDVSDPAAPVRLGGYNTGGYAYDVYVSGNLAYVADSYTGLQIIDVSDPGAPVWRGGYDTSGTASGVFVSGSVAYVAAGSSGLQIIDVSDPEAPVWQGQYDVADYACGVFVSGNWAYMADWDSGLQIIDVSDPEFPEWRDGYDTSGAASSVFVSGSVAYVADMGSGLQIIDVSDPDAPVWRGGYDTSGTASSVFVSGSVAYVADMGSGLQIIDVSDPEAPVWRGGYDTSGSAYGVFVSGALAYVADGEAGLVILHVGVNPPTDILLSDASVSEGLPAGTTVGVLGTLDPDAGDRFTYAFAPGPGSEGNGQFRLEGNTLKTAAPFDYEAQDSYNICVRSTDLAGGSIVRTFQILVAPVPLPWTGATDDHWETAENWYADIGPGLATTVGLDGTAVTQPVLYQNEGVLGVETLSAGWTIGGPDQTLTVGPGGIDGAGDGINTVAPNVALAADSTWTVGDDNALLLTGALDIGAFNLTRDGGGVLVVGGLVIDEDGGQVPQGCLDLGDTSLVVDYPDGTPCPIAEIATWVRAGLSAPSGYWDGNGITSSAAAAQADRLTAVGVLDNTDPKVGGKTTFADQAVDATSVLVKYTWWGDANLDGVVDANDYDVIDKGSLFPPAAASMGWWTGDFNYDGVIDANDYDKIDKAFLFQTGPLAPAAEEPLADSVPAPLAESLVAGTWVDDAGGTHQAAQEQLAVAPPPATFDAGIYLDADVWEEGLYALEACLSDANWSYELVEADDINDPLFAWDFATLILPGANGDDPSIYCSALTEGGRAAIQSFVSGGGGLLGICMGAYMSASSVYFDGVSYAGDPRKLGIFPGQAIGPMNSIADWDSDWDWHDSTLVTLPATSHPALSAYQAAGNSLPRQVTVTYAGGPALVPDLASPDAAHWACLGTYDEVPGAGAIFAGSYGSGRVVLNSPHLEFDDNFSTHSQWPLLQSLLAWTKGDVALSAVDWTGAVSGAWEDGRNWSASVVPSAGVAARFSGAASVLPVMSQDDGVSGIEFDTAGWSVGGTGHTLAVGSSGIDSAGDGSNTVAPNVALASDSTWTSGAGNALVLTGALDIGAFNLTRDGGGVLVVGGLAIDEDGGQVPQGRLDLGDTGLIVDYPDGTPCPISEIAAWVRAGLSAPSGYWDGNGITSSAAAAQADRLTAVGVLDNTDPKVGGKTEFAGRAVDATSVLVKYTWWGDANLDGVVDANDYDVIDKGFLFPPAPADMGWWTGDFNYDGVIDANDYDKIDRAFLFQTGPLAPASAVPLGQATPPAGTSDTLDVLALAVASGTVVRPAPRLLASGVPLADFASVAPTGLPAAAPADDVGLGLTLQVDGPAAAASPWYPPAETGGEDPGSAPDGGLTDLLAAVALDVL